MKIPLKYNILLLIFFTVLCTSLWAGNIYLLFLFSVLCLVIIPYNKWWDKCTGMLLIFSVFYALLMFMQESKVSGFIFLSILVAPVSFYRFGHLLMDLFHEERQRIWLLIFISFSFLISVFILTVKDIVLVGFINSGRVLLRDEIDAVARNATIYGLMVSIGIGFIGSIFTKTMSCKQKICSILLFFFSILTVVHLVNRTGLVILAICFFIMFVVSTKMNFSKMISTLIIVGVMVIVVVHSGFISQELIDAYTTRELYGVNAMSAGGRDILWLDAFENLFTSPFGWNRERYAHNMWLDIAAVGGWFCFLPFLAFTIIYIKRLLKIMKRSKNNFALIIISVSVALFLGAAVEPVVEASLLFFILMIMIWAMVIKLSYECNI